MSRSRVSLFAVAALLFGVSGTASNSSVGLAQTAQLPPPALPLGCTTDCSVSVSPALAFNPLGPSHTVTFVCGPGIISASLTGATTTRSAGGGPVTPGLTPGCYNVMLTATDITTGGSAAISSSTCGGMATSAIDGNSGCAGTSNPLPPAPSGSSAVAANTATMTIIGGAPHAFAIFATGYTPTRPGCVYQGAGAGSGCCPASFAYVPGPFTVTGTTMGIGRVTLSVVEGVCRFSLAAEKKYVEVTGILVTGGPCGGQALFAEGAKTFFGPGCTLTAYALGTVVLKTGVDCALEPPASGVPLPDSYPTLPAVGDTSIPGAPQAQYSCVDGTLSAVNIPIGGVNISFTIQGVGAAFDPLAPSLAGLCAGTSGAATSTSVRIEPGPAPVLAGASVTACPTGPGNGTISACLVSTSASQPSVCSSPVSFTFSVVAQRVVPYVKWSGEEVVLKKCFGTGLSYEPVEFALKGSDPALQATLLPVTYAPSLAPGSTQEGGVLSGPVGSTGVLAGTVPMNTTIWTSTDLFGCASVIGFATGQGVMDVDAAIYSTADDKTPLVNEHAFQVFYLALDHLDLENVKFATYSVARTLAPYLGFLARTPAFGASGPFTANGSQGLAPREANALLTSILPRRFVLPGPPGSGDLAPGTYPVPLCRVQYVRAFVHGYFQYPGDPSGRPGAPSAVTPGSVGGIGGSPPAGRWVLPEDWPLLATFAGFGANANGPDFTPTSVLAWDLNSGWAFNPTGEAPVLCGLGSGTVAGSSGLLLAPVGPTSPYPTSAVVNGNIPTVSSNGGPAITAQANGAVDLGPCFGQDASMTGTTGFYGTAPGSLTDAQQAAYNAYLGGYGSNCSGGDTLGINPFDATQACTDPYPLQYSPGGSGVTYPVAPGPLSSAVCGAPRPRCFDLTPTSANSSYLPNGTLNLWDAPMPPAQITFGIASGPGFLAQVNKTGFYSLTLDVPTRGTLCPPGFTVDSSGTLCLQLISAAFTLSDCAAVGGMQNGAECAAPIQTSSPCGGGGTRRGTSFDPITSTCQIELDPNPLYAEAIPSMPEIPPVSTVGAYLWDSWQYSVGSVTAIVSTMPPFPGPNGAPPGGFVPGESTSFTVPAQSCPPGFSYASAAGTCQSAPGALTATQCAAFVGATYNAVTAVCSLPAPSNAVPVSGGVNLTNFGSCGTTNPAAITNSTTQVIVANGTWFLPGMGVEVYSTSNGATIIPPAALTIAFVTQEPAFGPAAVRLTFTTAYTASCLPAYSAAFIGSQFGLPVGTGNSPAFSGAANVFIGPYGPFPVCGIDATNDIVYLCNAEAVAAAIGNCVLSRGPAGGPLTPGVGNCEPAQLVPPGTVIVVGQDGSVLTAKSNCGPEHRLAGLSVGAGGNANGVPPGSTIPSLAEFCAPSNPYPFWQWVSGVSAPGAEPSSAIMYSDNHGEAVVGLEQPVVTEVPPGCLPGFTFGDVNGFCVNDSGQKSQPLCPNNYQPVVVRGVVTSCLLPTGALGQIFQNVAAATNSFSAGNPGCLQTSLAGPGTGTSYELGGTTPAGQICVNGFGGIEFGAAAALGSTTVVAVADYPYAHTGGSIAAPPLTKVWTSAWVKSLAETPNGPGPAGTSGFILTVTALDVCGQPLTGEPVTVSLLGDSGSAVLSPLSTGGVVAATSSTATVFVNPGGREAGTATLSVEILKSGATGGLIAKALWPGEQIERLVTLIPGARGERVGAVHAGVLPSRQFDTKWGPP